MANLIDKTYFVGELDIPTNNVGISNNLTLFINKYEKKFKEAVWGTAIIPAELLPYFLNNDTKESMIANYVYFKWMNSAITITTGTGVVGTTNENSVKMNPAFKMTRAIRECRDLLDVYFCFINGNSTYPDWDKNKFIEFYNDEIKGINVFNI